MKFWRSPFFYFCLVVLCLIIFLPFFIGQGEKPFSLKRNIFDESQYLFSKSEESTRVLDLNIIGSTVFQPSAPPFLVSGRVLGALAGIPEKKEIEEYIVENGDNLSSIAQKFGISLKTLLWVNDLTLNSVLRPGQKLVILPTSGVLHIVREGDTLSELSQIYKADIEDIIGFNELSDEEKIYAGDFLIIPEGQKPKISQRYVQVPLSQSYFICPIPAPCRITQGLHWFNAIDFSNGKCWEPVFAAAGGEVQRTGYGSISGNYVRIFHPNGVITFYGHLAKIGVSPGQRVYQGQIIGYTGHTGYTIPAGPAGCHLHFDVRFAKNPFAY